MFFQHVQENAVIVGDMKNHFHIVTNFNAAYQRGRDKKCYQIYPFKSDSSVKQIKSNGK